MLNGFARNWFMDYSILSTNPICSWDWYTVHTIINVHSCRDSSHSDQSFTYVSIFLCQWSSSRDQHILIVWKQRSNTMCFFIGIWLICCFRPELWTVRPNFEMQSRLNSRWHYTSPHFLLHVLNKKDTIKGLECTESCKKLNFVGILKVQTVVSKFGSETLLTIWG